MDSLIQPEDKRFYVETPDPTFSPKRNQAIIHETIVETTKFFNDIVNKVDDELGNRIDIINSYGRYRFNTGQKPFEDYVGRTLYRQLIGEKILSRVRVMDTVNRLNGNTKYKNHILL